MTPFRLIVNYTVFYKFPDMARILLHQYKKMSLS